MTIGSAIVIAAVWMCYAHIVSHSRADAWNQCSSARIGNAWCVATVLTTVAILFDLGLHISNSH